MKDENNQVTQIEEVDEDVVKPKSILRDLLPYVAIVIFVVVLRTYVVTPVRVNGDSMVPTLENGETLILNKMAKFKRFDVVVIKTADENLIKRIIALPNETIEVRNEKLYINDEAVADNYKDGHTDDFGPITLKENEYFVMGDNREISKDSRYLGPIEEKYIIGTTSFRLLPLKRVGGIDK